MLMGRTLTTGRFAPAWACLNRFPIDCTYIVGYLKPHV